LPQYGTWIPYTGVEALKLALAMFVVAGLLVYGGAQLRTKMEVQRPGMYVTGLLAVMWLLSWLSFAVCAVTYFNALVQAVGEFKPPPSPIARVTALSGLAGFVAILYLARKGGWKVALGSAMAGMMAAPMIFELPFDLVVMGRLYPAPPEPAVQYTLLYFLPLFLVTLSSFALLAASPALRISRLPLFCLAGMFLVFAIWALLGFAYPAEPATIILNGVGKVLAFAAAVALFVS
jgi:hypothetical protein